MDPSSPSDPSGVEPEGVWPPPQKGKSVPGAGRLGMLLFLVSLAVSFLVAIVAYMVFRFREGGNWLPAEHAGLPTLLWWSTALIVACSGAVHWALVAVRADRQGQVRVASSVVLALAIIFTVCQGVAWREMAEQHSRDGARMYAVTFYLLTGLHALHVIGGLGLQGWVLARACLGHYWSLFHPGLLYSAMYWHFLDGVWIVLFGILWFGSR